MKGFELFELEEELAKHTVKVDINKLASSNIKQIVIPLHRFIEWKCFDACGNKLNKTTIFNSCLSNEDSNKAKQLNEIYMTRIWNLLDEDVTKDMNFDDFVD